MAQFKIQCVTRKGNGVIERVGLNNGESIPVEDAAYYIDERIHQFTTKTPDGLYEVNVHTQIEDSTGKPFLITYPDGRTANNLDYLNECNLSYYKKIDR